MATLATLVVRLVGDVGGLSSSLDQAGRNVSQFGRDIGQVGQSLTARVTAPIVGVGTAAVLMGNQFNAGMANVISLMPEAADEIAGLRGDVQGLAVEMGSSTTDMTDGLYQVVSAFGYTSESMEILRINAIAGAAGLASTTDAINLTSAVTKGYGDTTAEAAQKAADLALKTVQLGQTTFPELAASIGRVTPLAASLGVAQEELFAVMAAGTGVTGGAAEVSTQLRGVLQSLMAPTGEMTTLMTEMGYANGGAMLEGLGLHGSIQAILAAAEASGMPLQKYIGSIEGQTLALALGGPLADVYGEKLLALGDAAGTADLAFAAQTQGVNAAGFAMQQAAVRAQVLMQNIGNALGPVVLIVTGYVEQFVAWLSGLVDMFMQLDPQTQMIIFGVIGLVVAIGPLLMILGPLVTGFGLVMTAIGALLSPIGLVIAAVVLLAIAVVQHFGGVQETIQAASTFVQGIMQALAGFFQTNQAEIGATIDQAWTRIQETVTTIVYWVQSVITAVFGVVATFIDNHGQEIAAFLLAAWTQIRTIIDLALQLIQAVVTTVFGAVTAFITQHGTEIQAILTAAWDMIRSLIQIALDLIEGIIRIALAVIRGDWELAWTEVKTLVENLWTSIQTYIQAALDFIVGIVTLFVNTIVEWFTNLYNQLVGGSIIPDMVTAIVDWFMQLRDRVLEFVRDLRDRMIALITEVVEYWITKAILLRNTVQSTISNMRDNILNIVGGLVGGMGAAGAGMVRAFADGVMGALRSALDAARWLADQIRSLLPGSDAKTGPLSDLTASGRALPETLAAAITRGAPAAVDAAAGLAGGLADVLGMDTASLGAEAGLGWIDAMIKAIESRLPALQAAASEVWSSLGGQAGGAGFAGRPAVAEAGGGRSEARGGPVTINLYGPWQVSNEMDAQQVAEIIGEVLAGRAITNKRMNVAWATAGVA